VVPQGGTKLKANVEEQKTLLRAKVDVIIEIKKCIQNSQFKGN